MSGRTGNFPFSENRHDRQRLRLRADTLDETVHIIAAALGLSGGIDGDGMAKDYSFTPRDHETYARLPNAHQRANFIGSWLLAELNEASEVILGGG